jgi:MerR family transcriptional regulator, light-induced transcriptional regulator
MDVLSTNQLAMALGVSESSIKRWADDGTIKCARTAGGHRRIALAEAIRFVRDSRSALVRPELLGLPALGASAGRAADGAEALYGYLLEGSEAQVRALIQGMYLRGGSIAAIVDGPLRTAMQRLGDLWHDDAGGIFFEHRATDLCIQALNGLRALLPANDDDPVALGGAVAGDRYLLPSLAAATALHGERFRAVNLGPDVPWSCLVDAVVRLRPALVWITISIAVDAVALGRELQRLAPSLRGTPVIIGGQGIDAAAVPPLPSLHYGRSMGELVAFARGLRVGLG